MFENLLYLDYKRNLIQALGFFIFYFSLFAIIGMLRSMLAWVLAKKAECKCSVSDAKIIFEADGCINGIITHLALGFLILISKGALTPLNIFLVLLSGGISYWVGFIGMIIISFLTMI
jgi:hypothetical protein